MTPDIAPITEIRGARVLVKAGDSVTTDHISPAGAIPVDSPAGKYLNEKDVPPQHFNSFGSRRGNDRIMTRGTFGNIRMKNQLTPGKEGSHTVYFPTGEETDIYDAGMRYQEAGIPLIVLAGIDYGMGSSRDWAAKGTLLLGVKAVIAKTYERIHRSNLVGMGVLPLEFQGNDSYQTLGLDGTETYDILGLDNNLQPLSSVTVTATKGDGTVTEFQATVRLDTPTDVINYRHGGILHKAIRDML
jgi:aconitate hydratase